MTDTIPYTHWAYFERIEDAASCGAELEQDPATNLVYIETAVDGSPSPWLLRAARTVSTETDWHEPIKPIVERHGGLYDYGEMGEMFLFAAAEEAGT